MMEMKVKIEAPDLVAAINKLLAAIVPPDPNTLTPDEYRPSMPAPVAPAAPAAPATPLAPSNPTPAQASAGPVMTSRVPTAAPFNAPVTAPAPATPPAPAVPVSNAPAYTLEQISRAGASLVDAGKMEPLLALLARYGVAAVTQLQPELYGAFATELRALGAQI